MSFEIAELSYLPCCASRFAVARSTWTRSRSMDAIISMICVVGVDSGRTGCDLCLSWGSTCTGSFPTSGSKAKVPLSDEIIGGSSVVGWDKIPRRVDSYIQIRITNGRWVARSRMIRTRRTASAERNKRIGRMQNSGIRFCHIMHERNEPKDLSGIRAEGLCIFVSIEEDGVAALTHQGRHKIRQSSRIAAFQNVNG